MQKRMETVEVATTTEGMIELSQPDAYNEPTPIIIHPSQVPALVKWLQEAQDELEAASATVRQD